MNRHIVRMSMQISTLEERAEVEEFMEEARRILNRAIRSAHDGGLSVNAEILTMHTRYGSVPQISMWMLNRQHGAI